MLQPSKQWPLPGAPTDRGYDERYGVLIPPRWADDRDDPTRRPSRMTPDRRMFVLALILAASVWALQQQRADARVERVIAEYAEAQALGADLAHAAISAHAEAREALATRTLELLQVMCLKGLPYPTEVTGGKHGVTRWPACGEIVPAAKGAKP